MEKSSELRDSGFYTFPIVPQHNYRYGIQSTRFERLLIWYLRSNELREKTFQSLIIRETISDKLSLTPTKFIKCLNLCNAITSN